MKPPHPNLRLLGKLREGSSQAHESGEHRVSPVSYHEALALYVCGRVPARHQESAVPSRCLAHVCFLATIYLRVNAHIWVVQNYGLFVRTLNIRCRIMIGIQKWIIILTTTHMLELCRKSAVHLQFGCTGNVLVAQGRHCKPEGG